MTRDEAGLDIFWFRDASLEESDNLPDPVFSPENLQRSKTRPRTIPRF